MRIVDKAFGRQSAVLVRGDEAGSTAALEPAQRSLPESSGSPASSTLPSKRSATICIASSRCAPVRGRPAWRFTGCPNGWTRSRRGRPGSRVDARCIVEIADPELERLIRPEQMRVGPQGDAKVDTAACTPARNAATHCRRCITRSPATLSIKATPAFQEDLVDSLGRNAPVESGGGRAAEVDRGER